MTSFDPSKAQSDRRSDLQSRRNHRLFTIVTLVLPILLLVVSVVVSATDFYAAHSSYPYDTVIRNKLAFDKSEADILFVGDSALLCGVDPSIVQSLTDERSYNLGVPLNSFAAEKDLMIDRYLAHNHRPHLMVLYGSFQMTVSDFDPDRFHAYETGYTLVNAGMPRQALQFFARNPRRLALYGAIVLRNLLRPPPLSGRVHEETEKSLQAHDGFVACPEHGQRPLEQGPKLERVSSERPDVRYFEHLKEKYQAFGIKVVTALAPVPSCLPEANSLVQTFAPHVDLTMGQLPCEDFSGASNTHILPEYVSRNSQKLVSLLLPMIEPRRKTVGNE